MKRIYEACHEIKMDDGARERILAPKHHIPVGALLLAFMCIVIAIVLWPHSKTASVVAIEDETLYTSNGDEIIFNENVDDGPHTVRTVSVCSIIAQDVDFINTVKNIVDIDGILFESCSAMYRGILVPEVDTPYGYGALYFDQNDAARYILLYMSTKYERYPYDTIIPETYFEPSTIQDTQVFIFKGEKYFEAIFTKGEWNYDIQFHLVNEDAVLSVIHNILSTDIHPVAPVIDAYKDVEVKETVLLPKQEEISPTELYDMADEVAMIVIKTVEKGQLYNGEVSTTGEFLLYHRYKGEGPDFPFRYIRNGGIIDNKLTMHEDDVMIEQGKTYLAFLKRIDHKTVVILGGKDGLREVKEYVPSFDRTRLSFLNNRTGEFEPIVNILPDLDDYGESFVN